MFRPQSLAIIRLYKMKTYQLATQCHNPAPKEIISNTDIADNGQYFSLVLVYIIWQKRQWTVDTVGPRWVTKNCIYYP